MQLQHLVDLQCERVRVVVLHAPSCQLRDDGRLERCVPDAGHLRLREKVRKQAVEQWHVLRDQLRRVRVTQGAEEHQVLGQRRGLALQAASEDEDGLERAEAEVVVVLQAALERGWGLVGG